MNEIKKQKGKNNWEGGLPGMVDDGGKQRLNQDSGGNFNQEWGEIVSRSIFMQTKVFHKTYKVIIV